MTNPRRPGPPDWVVRIWPVWIVLGVALLVVGVVLGGNLARIGGPFALGLIFFFGGLGCAWRRFRRSDDT